MYEGSPAEKSGLKAKDVITAINNTTVTMSNYSTLRESLYGDRLSSVQIEYERDGVERKFPYCDYELIPISDWNYAYSSDKLELIKNSVAEVPFSSKNPPVMIKAGVKKIDWGYEDGYDTVCAKIPESREPLGDEEEILLYPYGCAKLRMTEIPKI